jgi:hypothetical protein
VPNSYANSVHVGSRLQYAADAVAVLAHRDVPVVAEHLGHALVKLLLREGLLLPGCCC